MKVTIIGGAGGMGRWFAKFFKKSGIDVTIVDKSARTGEIAAEMGVRHTKIDILRDSVGEVVDCLLYTSPSPRDGLLSRMPSSA